MRTGCWIDNTAVLMFPSGHFRYCSKKTKTKEKIPNGSKHLPRDYYTKINVFETAEEITMT